MPKGTSWDEAMSNSEKINPVALAFIKLYLQGLILPEGIRLAGRQVGGWAGRQAGRQAGSYSEEKNPLNNFLNS